MHAMPQYVTPEDMLFSVMLAMRKLLYDQLIQQESASRLW